MKEEGGNSLNGEKGKQRNFPLPKKNPKEKRETEKEREEKVRESAKGKEGESLWCASSEG